MVLGHARNFKKEEEERKKEEEGKEKLL